MLLRNGHRRPPGRTLHPHTRLMRRHKPRTDVRVIHARGMHQCRLPPVVHGIHLRTVLHKAVQKPGLVTLLHQQHQRRHTVIVLHVHNLRRQAPQGIHDSRVRMVRCVMHRRPPRRVDRANLHPAVPNKPHDHLDTPVPRSIMQAVCPTGVSTQPVHPKLVDQGHDNLELALRRRLHQRRDVILIFRIWCIQIDTSGRSCRERERSREPSQTCSDVAGRSDRAAPRPRHCGTTMKDGTVLIAPIGASAAGSCDGERTVSYGLQVPVFCCLDD